MILCACAVGLAWAGAGAGTAVVRLGDRDIAVEDVYQVGDTVFLPAGPVIEKLGGKTTWHADGRRLTVRFGERHASTTLFSTLAAVDGKLIDVGAKPRFLNGRLYLAAGFFRKAVPILTDQPVTLLQVEAVDPPAVQPELFVDQAGNRRRMLSLRRIVLDAGHGGRDPGAKSPRGIREKDINLAVTLDLADRLRRETSLEVVLTRSDDTFVPLSDRTAMANGNAADMFVSIHANGAYRRSATGFEVYFLSLRSSDDRAARLAAMENGPEHALPAPEDDEGTGDDLNSILRDMIRTENLASSERLAVAMQARLDLAMNLENRGVKQAPFFVLAGAQMPAVLIEVGFVTNQREAEMLTEPATRARIVDSLVDAILYYDAVSAASW